MPIVGLAQIVQALIALPQILSFVSQLVAFLKSQFGDNWQKYIADSGEAFRLLNEAKTSQEKIDAGKKLQDLLSRLG